MCFGLGGFLGSPKDLGESNWFGYRGLALAEGRIQGSESHDIYHRGRDELKFLFTKQHDGELHCHPTCLFVDFNFQTSLVVAERAEDKGEGP